MSVGAIGNGINSLLNRLSSVGPRGPQGPGSVPGARPPIDAIKPLPQRPSFQQRYQQDTFESGSGRQGRGGGGLDLSGGQARGGGAQAQSNPQAQGKPQAQVQAQSQTQPQAGASQGPQAARGIDAFERSKKTDPAEVTDFPKGQPPQKRAQSSKKAPPPQKPKAKKAPPPKKPVLGAAYKPVVVKGQVQMQRLTDPERKMSVPTDMREGSPATEGKDSKKD
jgi:hypothetical protein